MNDWFMVAMACICIIFGALVDLLSHNILTTLTIGLIWICGFLDKIAYEIRKKDKI